MTITVHEDVVCAFCGCLCDDLKVEVKENTITKVKNVCTIGRNKLLHAQSGWASIRVNGQEVSLEKALDEAANILIRAKSPLIYGLSSTVTEAVREAVALTELVRGTIDNPSSYCHGPGVLARQQVGLPTCTLGEVKNRADLLIYWGANPMESHLRHLNRYSAMARGLYTPEGRKNRKVVVIDVRPSMTSRNADFFFQVTPGRDFEVAHVLRLLARNECPEGFEETSLIGGVPLKQWRELAEIMKQCRYGVIMFGIGLTQSRGKDLNLEELNTLVSELNKYTRFYAIAMRGHGNVNGANQVLSWQTGYPLAVNFQRGYPRFNPGEFSVIDMLSRKEVDAALIIATDPGAHLPQSAVRYLQSIPTVVIEPYENLTVPWANVVIPVAPAGIGAEGTFYRMDNVPIRLKKVVDFPFPSDREVISWIKAKVCRLKGEDLTC